MRRNETIKVLVSFGTRPEAIKMCPVVKALSEHEELEVLVCATGQHREMLNQVLNTFGITPDFNLEIMKDNQTLFDITTAVLSGAKRIIESVKPSVVLVHGDTTSSFGMALAAFYLGVPIGHVEAGLRTYNAHSPWPEEFNRQAVDSMCDYYFAPTSVARDNLIREGKNNDSIYITGNTGIDALRTTIRQDYRNDQLEWAADSRLILITAHRRENLGEPMRQMLRAIRRVVDERNDVKVIYPIHKNPLVREIAHEVLDGCDRVRLIEPLGVLDFHNFMNACYLILTDSGGIQEEAPHLGKPVLVMRDTTERPEGISAGTLRLVGTSEEVIYQAFIDLLDNDIAYSSMAKAVNPYGDGYASERIAQAIVENQDLGKMRKHH